MNQDYDDNGGFDVPLLTTIVVNTAPPGATPGISPAQAKTIAAPAAPAITPELDSDEPLPSTIRESIELWKIVSVQFETLTDRQKTAARVERCKAVQHNCHAVQQSPQAPHAILPHPSDADKVVQARDER